MVNYNQSANFGKQLFFKFIKDVMMSKGFSFYRLSKETGISESTLSLNFKNKSEMTLLNFLKICGALEITPYLKEKAEVDVFENKIDFN